MTTFKPLEWIKRDYWVAESPAAGRDGLFMIAFEEGVYWPLWNADLQGCPTVEEAMTEAQTAHETFLRRFIVE